MRVVFTRTGNRRYGVRAEPAGHVAMEMNPAPGYDERLPHDAVHFVVETELGIPLGVFGQLAAGGDAGTFRLPDSWSGKERARQQRRTQRRGERLARSGRHDAELSERAAAICHHAWLARSPVAADRREARAMAPHADQLLAASPEPDRLRLTEAVIERVCAHLDRLSERWQRLAVGQSLVVEWSASADESATSAPRRRAAS